VSDSRHILFYDSDCPFCQFQVRALARMDWFNKVDFVPSKTFHQLCLGVHIDETDLNQAIHCVTHKKAVHRGARAIRFLGFRIPLLIPLSLFMWFPGMIIISDRIYKLISRNRYFLSRFMGCTDDCSLDTSEKKNPETQKLKGPVDEN